MKTDKNEKLNAFSCGILAVCLFFTLIMFSRSCSFRGYASKMEVGLDGYAGYGETGEPDEDTEVLNFHDSDVAESTGEERSRSDVDNAEISAQWGTEGLSDDYEYHVDSDSNIFLADMDVGGDGGVHYTDSERLARIDYSLQIIAGGVILAIGSAFTWWTILKPLREFVRAAL